MPRKPCPQCGYEGTKSHRQLMALYRKHFPGIPVWEMLKRRWIAGIDEPTDSQMAALVTIIRKELIRFFQLESEAELDGFIAGTFDPPLTRGLRTCNVEPDRVEV